MLRRTLPIILLFPAGCRTFDDVAPHRAFRVIGYVRGKHSEDPTEELLDAIVRGLR